MRVRYPNLPPQPELGLAGRVLRGIILAGAWILVGCAALAVWVRYLA